ncbi:MAG: hypothetical protein LBJ48_06460 [Coriobacteriales bacterium]|jgi:hypothetical protein|nr:hypothetical protein [Coriobacteriales bacterium]
MKPKGFNSILLAATLALLLALLVPLAGCGSLSRIVDEPAPPRESAAPAELTNLMRQGENYEGIELFHGSWDEPRYTEDKQGYFYEERGWIYLHLAGGPAERGSQHGWLLADYVERNVDYHKTLIASRYALDWEYLRTHAERLWTGKVSEELKAELEGIVAGAARRGASFDYLDLLVLNGLDDLRSGWFGTAQEQYYQELAQGLWEAPSADGEPADASGEAEAASAAGSLPHPTENAGLTGAINGSPRDTSAEPGETGESSGFTRPGGMIKQASALLATGSATEDGKLVLAHNTLIPYEDANFSNVMIDVEPREGQRFTMQAAPGFVHSVAEAYTTESLLIANTPIAGFNRYSEEGTPEFLRIRQAVQYARTLDEFTQTMVDDVGGGLASSWLVGELATGEIMELELGLAFYNEERTSDGCFISFDGVDDSRILRYETDGRGYTDTRQSAGARYVRLGELVGRYQGELTPELAQDIISDHYDVYLQKARASSRTICAHYDTDNAELSTDPAVAPYMPYGTVDATVMSTALAEEHTILARWGSACGRAFDSTSFLSRNPQYASLRDYLFDRPAQAWASLYPLAAPPSSA